MYSLKLAHLLKEHSDAEVYNFYIDIRAAGKAYEEFYDKLLEENIHFIRGRVAEVTDWSARPEEEGKLIIRVEDTLIGVVRRVPVDMVVLAVGMEPQADSQDVRRMFNISCSTEGFFLERHPKLAPVDTFPTAYSSQGRARDRRTSPTASRRRGRRRHRPSRSSTPGRWSLNRTPRTSSRKTVQAASHASTSAVHGHHAGRDQAEGRHQRSALQGMRHLRGHLSLGRHQAESVRGRSDIQRNRRFVAG